MILNEFYVSLKVVNKDYTSQLKKIYASYDLREGDMIYKCGADGKGLRVGVSKIIQITDEGLLLEEQISGKVPNKIIFLPFINEYGNKLIIEPFPPFNETIDPVDIENGNLKKDISVFDIYDSTINAYGEKVKYISWNKEHLIKQYEEFAKNINNIINVQLSLIL